MTSIIAIHGLAGSGKDSVAEILAEKYGYERIAFGDAVKDCLLKLNPIVHTSDYCDSVTYLDEMVLTYGWDEVKREYPEVRRLLQSFGTDVVRDMIGEDTWIDIALRKVKLGKRYVFTDVRFSNELSRLKKEFMDDLLTIKITRPGVDSDGHSSEAGLRASFFQFWIENSGSLSDLERNVDRVVELAGLIPVAN